MTRMSLDVDLSPEHLEKSTVPHRGRQPVMLSRGPGDFWKLRGNSFVLLRPFVLVLIC